MIGGNTICIYDGLMPEAIWPAAARNGLPVDGFTAVRELVPTSTNKT